MTTLQDQLPDSGLPERKNRLFARLQTLLLLAGLLCCLYGFSRTHGASSLPWETSSALAGFLAAFAAACAIHRLLRTRLGMANNAAMLALVALIGIMTGHLPQISVAGALALSATLFGRRVLRRWSGRDLAGNPVDCMLVGAGCYGTVVGIAAHFAINFRGVYWLLASLPVISAWSGLREQAAGLMQRSSRRPPPVGGDAVLESAIAGAIAMHLVFALLPEMGFDALAMHMLVASHMLYRHAWGFDANLYAMALIPMLGDWLFSTAYLLAGEGCARVFNLVFALVIALQLAGFVRWMGGDARSRRVAVLLFLLTPVTFTETSSLQVEAVWAAFLLAGIARLLRVWSDPRRDVARELGLAGLMLGFAAACKMISLVYFLPLGLLVSTRARQLVARDALAGMAGGALLLLAVGGIPYLTAWLMSGNPVMPFFNGIFRSPSFPPENFNNPLYNTPSSLALPYRVVFDAGHYIEGTVGSGGFQWLLLGPATVLALVQRRSERPAVILLLALSSLLIVFHFQSYLRYIFPVLALLTCVLATAVTPSADGARCDSRLLIPTLVGCLALNLWFLPSASWTYRAIPAQALIDPSAEAAMISARAPVRTAVEAINAFNLSRAPVAYLTGQIDAAGSNADGLFPDWYNYVFQHALEGAKTPEAFAEVMARYDSNLLILDHAWSRTDLTAIAERASTELFVIGQISVRRVRDELRYQHELLRSPSFEVPADWGAAPGAVFHQGYVTASATAPMYQQIKVTGGRSYRNQITASCDAVPTEGRAQVNWIDSGGMTISSSITVFQCTATPSTTTQYVTAPGLARSAIIYATSHSPESIRIFSASMR